MKLLNLTESFSLLKDINIAKHKQVKEENDLLWNFPYFMKIDSGEHKTEVKGVRKCSNLDEAKANLKDMKKISKKIVIQEAKDGKEMIIGIKDDKVFGKLLLVGFGGINAEVLKDVSFRALPVDKEEIKKMLEELKLYPSLVTRKKYAVDKFISMIEEVSKIAVKQKIMEMDLNPVILDEKDAYIVDARIVL